MGGVVGGDQVQRPVLGCLAVDLLEEFQPFDMGVVPLALTDDRVVENVERGMLKMKSQPGGSIS